MDKKSLPNFRRRVVVVSAISGGQLVLASPKFEDQGGVLFLVGKQIYTGPLGDKSFNDKHLAVAWSAVSTYFVFDTRTQYRAAMAKRRGLRRGVFRELKDLSARLSMLEAVVKKLGKQRAV